jgi:hypothetical protein
MTSRGWWAAALTMVVATVTPWAGAAPIEADLKKVGHSVLDHPGTFGDVAVVGRTAVVATDGVAGSGPCPTSTVTVVDLKNPEKPRVAATIPLPAGMAAAEVDGVTVITPTFTGDLVALALAPPASCPAAPGGSILYYDVTDPAAPRRLSEAGGGSFVAMAQRADERVLAVHPDATAENIVVEDLSDPGRPALLGRWPAPGGAGGRCAGAGLHEEGEEAVVVLADGRIHHLDLADPANPSSVGPAEETGGRVSPNVAVLPLGRKTVAILTEAGADDACPGSEGGLPGLRVLSLERGVRPQEETPVRYPLAGSPGRIVASGALAYVAWHGAGVRVVDFGEIQARTVANFAPSPSDVVGVDLLADHVVITDLTSGLYVLERPTEGGGRAGFWSQFLSFLPYMGFAVMAGAAALIPRLVGAAGAAGAGVPTPGAARVRRRRA